jgi:hypothetical protein
VRSKGLDEFISRIKHFTAYAVATVYAMNMIKRTIILK